MFNPVVKYGIGSLVCGLMAATAYFLVRLNSADATTHMATGMTLRAVPLACAPAIQRTALDPVTAVPGKACACVQQTYLNLIAAPERAAAADVISLIALTERAAARGVSADLSPYFDGIERIQVRHRIDGHKMGDLLERVNATLEACATR